MKYRLNVTGQFKKSLKLCLKRGYDRSLLEHVIELLVEGEKLPAKYKAHRLNSKFNYCWECHVTPDWLLLWEQNDDELTLLLVNTGTHSDIF
jgi:addiction module toxin, relE/stbE family